MRAGAAGASGLAALALLLPMEALRVPIPLPADLVMFTVGERVAAGRFPLWLAVTGFEVIAVVGTTALFLACRGPGAPGHLPVRPAPGPHRGAGGPPSRLRSPGPAARPGSPSGVRRRGCGSLAVVAAGVAGLSARRALPALIAGSSVFLQLHLVLGLLLGPLAGRGL